MIVIIVMVIIIIPFYQKAYAKTRISPGILRYKQIPKSGSEDQNIVNKKKKKKKKKLPNSGLVGHRVKIKENEKKDKYLNLVS